jgi:hypothetical protein
LGRERDPSIYVETVEELSDRLEQVDECIVAGYDAIGCLIFLDVIKIPTYNVNEKMARTLSRMARPACTAFAGGNIVYKDG